MKRIESVRRNSRSSDFSSKCAPVRRRAASPRYALCVENRECEDLEKRKVYRILPDKEAEKEGYLRVVDESGEDCVYPASYFVLLKLPTHVRKALMPA